MNPEMKPWNDKAAATGDPQTQGTWPDSLRDDWRAMLAADRPLEAVWHGGAFPLQRRRESEAMVDLCENISHRVIMEIGADKGGGLINWLSLSPDTMIALEVRGCPYADILRPVYRHTKFLFGEASSYDDMTVRHIGDYLDGRPVDILFIDGDKANFLRDFDAYRPFMRPGGIVFMHDITDRSPGMAFAEVELSYVTAKIIDTTESAEAMIRERNGIDPASPHEAWLRTWQGRSCGVGVIHIPEN